MKPANPKSDSAIRAAEKIPPASTLRSAIGVVTAIADAIRDLKEVPSGTLYAAVMSKVSIDEYEKIIGIIEGAGLIKRSGSHLLTWIGPR